MEASGVVSSALVTRGGRSVHPDTPGGQVLSRMQRGELVVFYGACTPFRALLLENLNHFDAWLSSFELSALLGERDDESIGFDETRFFLDRIHRRCPRMNVFVDCDTGWSDDPEALTACFSQLAGKVAMVCIENLVHGQKDNSFLRDNPSRLEQPEAVATKVRCIAGACRDVLVVLRMENNILGQPLAATIRYVRRLMELEAPYDMLLLHHRGADVEPVLAFATAMEEIDPELPLAVIATSYLHTPNLIGRLRRHRHGALVIPNYAARHEYRCASRVYSRLIAADFAEVEAGAASMDEVIGLVYRAEHRR